MSNLSTYSDEQLVEFLKGDNKGAFAELYNRYWKKLLVQAVFKLKNEPEAEEIVQSVFLDIWRRRFELDIRYTFHTYIASCIKYKIVDSIARAKRKRDFEKNLSALPEQSSNNSIEWADYENTRRRLEKTVRSLPEKCQLVFRLSREAGLSDKQIAEQMEISVKTVETHMTKALKILRSSLQQLLLLFLF